MVLNRNTRAEVNELIASCEVISEFAARADLPEVDAILTRLLYVLTDDSYGSARLEAAGYDAAGRTPRRPRGGESAAAKALHEQFRAFGRISGPG